MKLKPKDIKVKITWYNWEGKIEQTEVCEVEHLGQAEMAGIYECEQQGFDHYTMEVVR